MGPTAKRKDNKKKDQLLGGSKSNKINNILIWKKAIVRVSLYYIVPTIILQKIVVILKSTYTKLLINNCQLKIFYFRSNIIVIYV